MFRIALRVILYPSLFYTIFIYTHAKYNDPKGFSGLCKATCLDEIQSIFWFDSQSQEQNEAESENSTDETKEFDFSFLDHLEEVNLEHESTAQKPQSILEDLKSFEKTLYDISLLCNWIESEAIENKDSEFKRECFSAIPYQHRVMSGEIFAYIKPLHTTIEKNLLSAVTALEAIDYQDQLIQLSIKIDSFLDSCGPECLPLAKINYSPSPPEVIDIYHSKYDKSISDIKAALKSKLLAVLPKLKQQAVDQPEFQVNNVEGLIKASSDIAKIINNSSDHPLIKPYIEKLKYTDQTTGTNFLTKNR